MVMATGADPTRTVIAQADSGYTYRLYLDSVREGDTITVDINGTKYAYTLKAGENAEAAATGLANAINFALDINAASGTIIGVASSNSFGDASDPTTLSPPSPGRTMPACPSRSRSSATPPPS